MTAVGYYFLEADILLPPHKRPSPLNIFTKKGDIFLKRS